MPKPTNTVIPADVQITRVAPGVSGIPAKPATAGKRTIRTPAAKPADAKPTAPVAASTAVAAQTIAQAAPSKPAKRVAKPAPAPVPAAAPVSAKPAKPTKPAPAAAPVATVATKPARVRNFDPAVAADRVHGVRGLYAGPSAVIRMQPGKLTRPDFQGLAGQSLTVTERVSDFVASVAQLNGAAIHRIRDYDSGCLKRAAALGLLEPVDQTPADRRDITVRLTEAGISHARLILKKRGADLGKAGGKR